MKKLKITKRTVVIIIAVILGLIALLYLCGVISQLYGNYADWDKGGGVGSEAEMRPVNWNPFVCIAKGFSPTQKFAGGRTYRRTYIRFGKTARQIR